MPDPIEPVITVNGFTLSVGQAMSVRVAITSYMSEMGQPGALGDDEHGRAMAQAYQERLSEVCRLIMWHGP